MTEEQKRKRECFLEPETRCDYYIDAKMKSVWKALLDILEEIMRVCDKYNLQWTLEGGSLLGAIRHNGFIPWDDDIDVVMPREDYDKLVKVLPNELPPHLFMQTTSTDIGFHIPHVMVRDSRTTGIDIDHIKWGKKFNMGIRVDILALDGMPDTSIGRWMMRHFVSFFVSCVPRDNKQMSKMSLRHKIKQLLAGIFFRILGRNGVYKVREACLRMCQLKKHKYCGSLVARNFYHPHSVREYAWFRGYKKIPFEYLEVPVPIDAEKILTQQFGDWKRPVKGGSYHGVLISDPHVDYKTYLKAHYNYCDGDFEY